MALGDEHYWLSPTGTSGLPGTSGNPAPLNPSALRAHVAGVSGTSIHIHLAAGTYTNGWLGFTTITNALATKLYIHGDTNQPPHATVLLFPSDKNWARDPYGTSVCSAYVPTSSDPWSPLGHFQLENLTLDGNWSNQLANTSPAYEGEARVNGLTVVSHTGLIRNVIVRNVGVHGRIPHSRYSSPSFTEGFVFNVSVPDIGQAAPAGQDLPWVIEDCELNDFGSVYNGYVTAFHCGPVAWHSNLSYVPSADQSKVDSTLFNHTTRRIMAIRRNQVRPAPGYPGHATGMAAPTTGTADCFAVWSDNALLNTTRAFNDDTGLLWRIDFTNNVCLDVQQVFKAGLAHHGNDDLRHRYLNFSGNTARLDRRRTQVYYGDFIWRLQPNGMGGERISDKTQVIGGLQTNRLAAMVTPGGLGDLTMKDNWFTTRPLAEWTPAPSGAGHLAQFKLLWKTNPTDMSDRTYTFEDPDTPYYVSDYVTVALSDNKVSNTAMDFAGLTSATAMTGNYDYNEDNSHNTYRDPLTGPSGFTPFGELRRVQSVYENRSITNTTLVRSGFPPSYSYATNIAASNTKVLIGAYELVAGTPQYTSNNYTVSLRLRFHPTPTLQANQSLVRQSTAHPTNVYVEVLSGGASSVGIRTNAIDANGVASFTITPSGSGVDRLRFWYDGVGHTHATTAEFDEYYDAWGTAEVPVGPMVSLVALPDVADDQWLQPGLLRFYRTDTNGTLQVNFTLPTYMAVEFNSSGVLVTNNRTAVRTTDYNLHYSTNNQPSASSLSGSSGTVTFGAGQSEIHLKVTPISDFSTEGEVVAVELASGTGYTVGPKRFATVYIWDGPEWRVYELSNYSAYPSGVITHSTAYALNDEDNAKIAGRWTLYYAGYGGSSVTSGGYWTVPTYLYPTHVGGGYDFLGISTPGSNPLTLVGYSGTSARKWVSGSGFTTLSNLFSAPSRANAVSPDGAYIVGEGTRSGGYTTAIRWNVSTAEEVASAITYTASGLSKAHSVNSSGMIAGEYDRDIDSHITIRGFATGGGNSVAATKDELPPSEALAGASPTGNSTNSYTWAYSIRSSGLVVGAERPKNNASGSARYPVYWYRGDTGDMFGAAQRLGTWVSDAGGSYGEYLKGVASAVGTGGHVAGAVYLGGSELPCIWDNVAAKSFILMTDSDRIYLPPGITVSKIRAVNAEGEFVGEANVSGSTRGIVVVRR